MACDALHQVEEMVLELRLVVRFYHDKPPCRWVVRVIQQQKSRIVKKN